jgi:YVTN family beta-propeller protein
MTATYRSKTATARLVIIGLISTISGLAYPICIASSPNGAYVFVSDNNRRTVSVIDTASLMVIENIDVEYTPQGITCSPDGAYVLVCVGDSVSIISIATLKVIKTIKVSVHPRAIACSPDNRFACVCNYNEGTISIIDIGSLEEINKIAVGISPIGVVGSRDSTRFYVANSGSNTISIISTANWMVTESINIQVPPEQIINSPDDAFLFVCNTYSNRVTKIDLNKSEVIGSVVNENPIGIAISPDGSRVYVSNINKKVSIIDAESLTVTNTISVGLQNREMVSSPDGSRIFVCNYTYSTISVISVG